MKCRQVTSEEGGTHSVEMYPVTGGSEENDKFFKFTPGGKLELCVLNKQNFEPGKEYIITIDEAV